MPVGEALDYIKLISQAKQEEAQERALIDSSEKSSSIKDDIAMAGNTLPGGIF